MYIPVRPSSVSAQTLGTSTRPGARTVQHAFEDNSQNGCGHKLHLRHLVHKIGVERRWENKVFYAKPTARF